VLGKWFKKKSVPANDGNLDPLGLDKIHFGKVFDVELSNMEDTPVYSLTHQLTIGSEIGNIVIADTSISPRHATLTVQDEVVSLVDHGSIAGTFINGKKIDPGKNIILQDTDIILVGDLEIRVIPRKLEVKEQPVQTPEVTELVELTPVKKSHRIELKKTPVNIVEIKKSLEKKKKKKPLVLSAPVDSANAVVRVFAVGCDLLLSYSILIIFSPFDEFRDFLDFIPSIIGSSMDVEWTTLWEAFLEDYGFLKEIFNDVENLISLTFKISSLLLIFILNRAITTLLFGVSISEYCLGMRPSGNFIWSRVGGVIRVVFGVLSWPFIIFDVTAIVSRRTLKEFITFTNINIPSTFVAVLGLIFYVPLIISITALSPLVQGLEPPEAILFNDKIEQRVKLKLPELPADQNVTPIEEVSDSSSVFNLGLTYNPAELVIMPHLKFRGIKDKVNLHTSMLLYQRDLKRQIEIEIFKTFDLKQLLSIGFKGNFFLYDKYPELYRYIYEMDGINHAFKKNVDAKSQFKFANEFIEFTKTAFSLTPETAFEIMETQSPLLKGFVDYKSSLLSLIEYKDFDSPGVIKIGDTLFIILRFKKQKPFDLLIPLIMGEGKIFKVSYDKKDNLNAISSKLYKFNLENSSWNKAAARVSGDKMSSLEVLDFFTSSKLKTSLLIPEKALSWYGYSFDASSSVLKRADPIEIEIWKLQISEYIRLISLMSNPKTEDGDENIKEKLLQNFKDMLDALENNNVDYFGISQTQSV
jgi:pSer/pThr/pTyr-binding forkhead associated (FHA) protein